MKGEAKESYQAISNGVHQVVHFVDIARRILYGPPVLTLS
jgi:hypothetical protein